VTINIRLGIDRVTKIFISLQAIENIYSTVIALWLDTHKHTTNIHLTILIRQELPFDHTHTIHTHTHTQPFFASYREHQPKKHDDIYSSGVAL
jgi:hypothetical protein